MKFNDRSEEEQKAFFDKSLNQYRKAAQYNQEFREYFAIANTTFCLCFAGEGLRGLLTSALQHLKIGPVVKVDVTFHIWDTESTQVDMSPPPCDWVAFTERGDIWGFNSKRIRSAFHWSDYSVNLYDQDTSTGIYWVKQPSAIPYWTTSAPFRTLFQWAFRQRDMHMIHAAAIGLGDNFVVITGKGGVGKSSTALACLDAEMDYLGDDYIIVENGATPKAYTIYNTAKLFNKDKARFPRLARLLQAKRSKEQEKGVYYLYPELQQRLKLNGWIKAVLIPSITNSPTPTNFQIVSKAVVQKAIAFTTISQLPGAGQDTNEYIAKLIESIPCFEARLSNDFLEIPSAIEQLLLKKMDMQEVPEYPSVSDYPLISIIIPVYNAAEFILQAIENIDAQAYPHVEILVIDDGSTDNLKEVLEDASVDVRYIHQENTGPSGARNKGILNASGSYIAFLDVDDYWPDDNLTTLFHELCEEKETMVVQGFAQVVRHLKDDAVQYIGNPKESFPFYIGASLYRSEVFNQVGLFDTSLKYGEDTDWYNRLIELGLGYKRLDQTSLFVRRHGKNMTEGKDLVDLGVLQVFKKKLERDRTRAQATSPQKEANNKPLISVVIPVFNGELFVAEAIDSVLKQDFRPIEIIVVNDGSTDRTSEALAIFGDDIRVINQPNSGVAQARNVGVEASNGDYISFLDADDLWHPTKLAVQFTQINAGDADIIVGLTATSGLDGDIEEFTNLTPQSGVLSMNPGAALFRKNVFELVGSFDRQMSIYEDVDWFFRAREAKVKINVINALVLINRQHKQTVTSIYGSNAKQLLPRFRASLKRRKHALEGNMRIEQLSQIDGIKDLLNDKND